MNLKTRKEPSRQAVAGVVAAAVSLISILANLSQISEWFHRNDTVQAQETQTTSEKTTNDTPDSSKREHTYQVFNESLSWWDAKAKCEEMGGHLVSIESVQEQRYIESLIKNPAKEQYWIGLYLNSSRQWTWVDGTAYKYTNWDYDTATNTQKPDNLNGTERYVRIAARTTFYDDEWGGWQHNATKWDDTDAEADGDTGDAALSTFGFICEWDAE